MVEFDGIPVVECVALHAIRNAVFFKLPAMHVFVTGCASGRHVGKLLKSPGQMSFVVFFPVTRHTCLFRMGARQFEPGNVMVEMVFFPACRDVAFFARLIGVEFFIQVPVVHVRMAVRTFFTDISELPFFIGILLVTGKTRRCHMPAFQLEFRFVVIVNCEQTSGESIDSVAFGTIGAKPEDGGQLPFMVIFMTGVAGIMRKWIGKII